MFPPIRLINLSLCLPHKTCFEDFCAVVAYGSKIALIGDNGTGKSSLIKKLAGLDSPVEGRVEIPADVTAAYVPQTVTDFPHLSGGQRFNKKLSEALSLRPDVLLLDEPTNHLDIYNRRALMNMLGRFKGTLIVASHDEELLSLHTDRLWHIDGGAVRVFSGGYADYWREHAAARAALEAEKSGLLREQKRRHEQLMKEQQRAAKSRAQGELNRKRGKWAPIAAGGKERLAQYTAGRKSADISSRREELNSRLDGLFVPEILTPSFTLSAAASSGAALLVSGGGAGYAGRPVLTEINLVLEAGARAAVTGTNGSGKSTFLRAVLGEPQVEISGVWDRPAPKDVGYLDQHYSGPLPGDTVLDYVGRAAPGWTHERLRRHLNAFLFRKNEEVNASVAVLSGGERARLALAAVACRVPRLLVLDEITNNLDLRAKEHVAQVLKDYPGAFLIVSHEPEFLKQIGVTEVYAIRAGRLGKARPEEGF